MESRSRRIQQMNIKSVHTSQEAWEYLNEYILLNEKKLKQEGAGRDGNASFSYDNLIFITKAWIDPNFDFGKVFGYRMQKWSHLVNNYVDLNQLDILKAEILSNERTKKRTYNISFYFSNSHGNGKGCLISCTFSRRLNSDIPILIFNTRATEVTRRLLVDLLLIQRIGEYVYGLKQAFSIQMYLPMAYIQCESFQHYIYYKGKVTFSQIELPFQRLIRDTWDKFITCNPSSIKYTSHQRIAKHIQMKGIGHNKLLASELNLQLKQSITYPPDCLTDKQRQQFRKQLKKPGNLL